MQDYAVDVQWADGTREYFALDGNDLALSKGFAIAWYRSDVRIVRMDLLEDGPEGSYGYHIDELVIDR